jgi:radical SAM protein with 4Fe4S-binding SPASM domain
MESYAQWHLPRLGAEYLRRCDGQTSHAEICRRLKVPARIIVDQVASHLVERTGAIVMADGPTPDATNLLVTGSLNSFAPLHLSVEITDTCNFRCDHCYVSASPDKLGRRTRRDLFSLFNTMRANGVRVVELTGGECTTHPDFERILEHASKTFHLVAVVTNGYLIGRRERLADCIGSFENVCTQVSIDGNEEFHDAFRKKAGSYASAVEAVRRLKRLGLTVRVAMTATSENVEHVEHVFLLAKELGVDAFSVAPAAGFGRGASIQGCGTKESGVHERIRQFLAPYAGDSMFESNRAMSKLMTASSHQNCGAGWRSFALNGASGEVRSCLYLADSKKFGSVDDVPYEEVFKQPDMALFRHAPSPSPALETCKECDFITECSGCFAKAFLVSQTKHPGCAWRTRYFTGMQLAPSGPTQLVQLSTRRTKGGRAAGVC